MKVYHFISEQFALDVISDQRLKISLLNDLNDPFELNAVDLPDYESRKKASDFKKHMANQYGILCFSKGWRNPLLWSHYANRHKGVAIEIEVQDNIAHPIKYRKNRYVLDSKKQKSIGTKFNKKDIEGIWFTKYRQWKYEEEIRVIVDKSECVKCGSKYFHNFNQEVKLKGFVLGPLCKITVEMIEEKLPLQTKLTIIKSRLAFRSYKIVKQKKFHKRILIGTSQSAPT